MILMCLMNTLGQKFKGMKGMIRTVKDHKSSDNPPDINRQAPKFKVNCNVT